MYQEWCTRLYSADIPPPKLTYFITEWQNDLLYQANRFQPQLQMPRKTEVLPRKKFK